LTEPIRLLLADDQALVRGALAALLRLESDLEVVAQVATGGEVVPAALASRPDVALIDAEMGEVDGITATRRGGTVGRPGRRAAPQRRHGP
jgi:two-component system, NarL family, response regulator DesR